MSDGRSPWQLRTAGTLLALEGLGALALAVWALVEAVTGGGAIASTIALAVICAGSGTWILLAARRLRRGRSWARAAGVFVQLVLIAIAAGSLGGPESSLPAFIALLVPALLTGVLLFTRPVIEATRER